MPSQEQCTLKVSAQASRRVLAQGASHVVDWGSLYSPVREAFWPVSISLMWLHYIVISASVVGFPATLEQGLIH